MFMHILKTLVQVILVFFFLIIAFALAFTVLMQNEVGLLTFYSSWVRFLIILMLRYRTAV